MQCGFIVKILIRGTKPFCFIFVSGKLKFEFLYIKENDEKFETIYKNNNTRIFE